MAIDFTGHCRLPRAEAQRRIEFARRARPEWYATVVTLTDALDLGPFGREIAAEFGIEAECKFCLFVLDKERLDEVRDAVEFLYQVFGTDDLVITWGNDTIRPPLRQYEATPIG
jgi:hypothetical protein